MPVEIQMTLRDLALICGSCVAAALASAMFAQITVAAANGRRNEMISSRKFDPPMRTKLELSLESVAIAGQMRSNAPSSRDTLVVAAGSCSACSRHAIDALDPDISAYRRVLFYYRATIEELHSSLPRTLPKNVTVIADSNGKMHEALNAFFTPRLYELDARNVLIRIQSEPNNFRDFGLTSPHTEH